MRRRREEPGWAALTRFRHSVAVVTTLIVLVTFVFTTPIHKSASLVTLLVILARSMALDTAWKRSRDRRQVVS